MSDRVLNKFEWQLMRRKDDGAEDERARTLHLSKRLGDGDDRTTAFANDLSQIEGVEGIQPAGPYAIQVFIGRCFDVGIVVADVEAAADRFLSDLVLPNKTVQLHKID